MSSGFGAAVGSFGDRAAQHRFDALDQKPLRERFADEIVGAHLQAEQLVDLLVLGGEEDHRHVGLLAQPPQQLHAVHARHLDVEDGEVGRRGLEPLERGGAVGVGHDPVAFGLERDRDRGQNVPVVVDESDGRHKPCIPLYGSIPAVLKPAKLGRNVASVRQIRDSSNLWHASWVNIPCADEMLFPVQALAVGRRSGWSGKPPARGGYMQPHSRFRPQDRGQDADARGALRRAGDADGGIGRSVLFAGQRRDRSRRLAAASDLAARPAHQEHPRRRAGLADARRAQGGRSAARRARHADGRRRRRPKAPTRGGAISRISPRRRCSPALPTSRSTR